MASVRQKKIQIFKLGSVKINLVKKEFDGGKTFFTCRGWTKFTTDLKLHHASGENYA